MLRAHQSLIARHPHEIEHRQANLQIARASEYNHFPLSQKIKYVYFLILNGRWNQFISIDCNNLINWSRYTKYKFEIFKQLWDNWVKLPKKDLTWLDLPNPDFMQFQSANDFMLSSYFNFSSYYNFIFPSVAHRKIKTAAHKNSRNKF